MSESVFGKRFSAGYHDGEHRRHFWISSSTDGQQRSVLHYSKLLDLSERHLRRRILAALEGKYDIDLLDTKPRVGSLPPPKKVIVQVPMTIADVDQWARSIDCVSLSADQWARSFFRQRAVTDSGEADQKHLVRCCYVVGI